MTMVNSGLKGLTPESAVHLLNVVLEWQVSVIIIEQLIHPAGYSQGVKCIFLVEPGKWVQSFFLNVFMLYRYCTP